MFEWSDRQVNTTFPNLILKKKVSRLMTTKAWKITQHANSSNPDFDGKEVWLLERAWVKGRTFMPGARGVGGGGLVPCKVTIYLYRKWLVWQLDWLSKWDLNTVKVWRLNYWATAKLTFKLPSGVCLGPFAIIFCKTWVKVQNFQYPEL